jgi:hypothetical protein
LYFFKGSKQIPGNNCIRTFCFNIKEVKKINAFHIRL